jgi:AbrB family looped-hinge helix DNA binding protein
VGGNPLGYPSHSESEKPETFIRFLTYYLCLMNTIKVTFVARITKFRRIHIPKAVFEGFDLSEGDIVEVTLVKKQKGGEARGEEGGR